MITLQDHPGPERNDKTLWDPQHGAFPHTSVVFILRVVVMEPKPVYPMLRKTKTQNVSVCSKESFIDREGANLEDGKPNGPSNPSCLLD